VEVEALIACPDIDLVYIATPPFLHYPQARLALQAGKHVISEKPLAMNLREADDLIHLSRKSERVLVANLMQRYNPLFELIRQLIESKLLGEFLHGYFENYAADEGLPPEHWFWDRAKSGGIFIEHGVHFFDLFSGWLGPGEVVAGQRVLRPGTDFEEQVNCTVRYRGGALVNFYHGFTQPRQLDRQEFRLFFERGDVTLEEWVPVRARVRAVADEKQTRELMALLPGQLDVTRIYGGRERAAFGRHKPLDIYQKIELSYGLADDKMHRYGRMLQALVRDQLRWIYDRNHVRKLTEVNGRESLAMALAATRLANESE